MCLVFPPFIIDATAMSISSRSLPSSCIAFAACYIDVPARGIPCAAAAARALIHLRGLGYAHVYHFPPFAS